MKANPFKPLVWSIVSTFVLMVLFWIIARAVFNSGLIYNFSLGDLFVWLNHYIGYPMVYLLFSLPLFLLVFAYFDFREKRGQHNEYLKEINQDIQRLADGYFEHKVQIRPSAELSQLAVNINRLVERLKYTLEEERKAEQSKNELITNVSHDLRTPLTSITGYLGLIEQDRYRDEVELRYYVSMAYEESQRLSQLIQDLFEYTRLRNNEMKLRTSKINLIEMLWQITEQFRLQLSEANMEPRLLFDNNQLIVLADGNKLRRVFENLFTNSIKYGQKGKYLDITGRMDNQEVVVEITNYGEAIPPADLPYIFERFFRVEKSRNLHSGGSGIGLAIAKQIVDLHGGTIEAASDSDLTCFSIRLKQSLNVNE
ncbi:sensor histidine kinase [Paenibacillus psychroresistens]|uniref:histidine kinase n=1 Tax=Paenibacillus psychroresistens TaxID=1778678 RepID=A0A6B8RW58_9BACL|nr:HAMP domain-containing sensor histidine kinase [Paenibacillus psychroresistens]QGQ99446.1 sensor histidine kinase [Paenibacillus psychroresistens]